MNTRDKDILIKKVMGRLPKETNRDLIKRSVLKTLKVLNTLPWYKRILKY